LIQRQTGQDREATEEGLSRAAPHEKNKKEQNEGKEDCGCCSAAAWGLRIDSCLQWAFPRYE
jgi:hypothetical protein